MSQARAEHRKKMLFKLVIARVDMLTAEQTCELLLDLTPDPGSPLYVALNNALVVAYARPFTNNKPLGALPARWQRFGDARQSELHADLLAARNRVVAHSQMFDGKVVIVPRGSRFSPGDPPMLEAVGIAVDMFAPDVISDIRDLCRSLRQRIHEEAERLLDILYPPRFYAPRPIEITLRDL
jgi:hypothetical protein